MIPCKAFSAKLLNPPNSWHISKSGRVSLDSPSKLISTGRRLQVAANLSVLTEEDLLRLHRLVISRPDIVFCVLFGLIHQYCEGYPNKTIRVSFASGVLVGLAVHWGCHEPYSSWPCLDFWSLHIPAFRRSERLHSSVKGQVFGWYDYYRSIRVFFIRTETDEFLTPRRRLPATAVHTSLSAFLIPPTDPCRRKSAGIDMSIPLQGCGEW